MTHTTQTNPRPGGPRADCGITVLCTRYWPDRHGGVEKRLWHVTRGLARAGVPVDVVTENRVGAPPKENPAPNLVVHRIDPMDPGRMWRWPAIPRVVWWRKAIHRLARRPTIWATDPTMAVAALTAGHGKQLVYNPAGCIAAMRRTAKINEPLTTMWRPRHLAWLDRYGYQHANKIVVGSHNVRRQLENFYGCHGNLHVVPHGVGVPFRTADRATARAKLGIDDQAYLIGAVGRLDPCKGLDDLLRAVKISGCRKTARILLVGDGPDKARLEAIARRLGLGPRIVWTGDLKDPSPAYAAMDVLAMPSIYEAFGNVILEAMAHGVPVVGRRGNDINTLTACDEIIDDGRTGLLTDPLSTADLAAKLTQLYLDPAARRKMGLNAAMRARTRSWGIMVDDYLKLLGIRPPHTHQTIKGQRAA